MSKHLNNHKENKYYYESKLQSEPDIGGIPISLLKEWAANKMSGKELDHFNYSCDTGAQENYIASLLNAADKKNKI